MMAKTHVAGSFAALTCSGRKFPTAWQKRLSKLRFDLRERLATHLAVTVGDFNVRFVCQSPMEEMRVRSLLVKEEGTIQWLRQYLRPGDVFLDVGANIGLYSLVAASLVGDQGRVYAVEPHAVNTISLMRNVAANGLEGRVSVIGSALHHSTGVFNFNYFSLEPGSAMSQLGETRDADEEQFQPVITELKLATSVDDLIGRFGMAPPCHVKIDVDGNERHVIEGMMSLLRSEYRPRSVQVEINKRDRDELFARFNEARYEQTLKHYTAGGKWSLAQGADPSDVPYNAVFEPQPDSAPMP
jgi:FkbM family methyltransferase